MGSFLSIAVRSQWLERHAVLGTMTIGSAEMQGYRRKMEDALDIRCSEGRGFLAVYDGHDGDKASAHLKEHLGAEIMKLKDPTSESDIASVCDRVDKAILDDANMRNNGSCAVFAIVHKRIHLTSNEPVFEITIGNVGDSRAILVRKDEKQGFEVLTTDHHPTLEKEKKRIHEAGGYVKDERVDGRLAVSRAFGDYSPYKTGEDKKTVVSTPDVTRAKARKGDVLLLCCDGVFESMTNDEVVDFVRVLLWGEAREEPAVVAQKLIDRALGWGSRDNTTAICAVFDEGPVHPEVKTTYVPGSFHKHKSTDGFQDFSKAYLAFGQRHGLTEDEVRALIPKEESSSEYE